MHLLTKPSLRLVRCTSMSKGKPLLYVLVLLVFLTYLHTKRKLGIYVVVGMLLMKELATAADEASPLIQIHFGTGITLI